MSDPLITPQAGTLSAVDKTISRESLNSPFQKALSFWQGVREEWHHITWPKPVQLWGQTIIVVVLTALMTSGLWFLDNTFRVLVQAIVPHN